MLLAGGVAGGGAAGLTRVQVGGACDMAARFWPPVAPCMLPPRTAALRWTPRSPQEEVAASRRHDGSDGARDATPSVPSMTERPVIIVWKVLPPGFGREVEVGRGERALAGTGGGGGGEVVAGGVGEEREREREGEKEREGGGGRTTAAATTSATSRATSRNVSNLCQ